MQPLSLSTAFGHGSSVTPGAAPPPESSSRPHPATAMVTVRAVAMTPMDLDLRFTVPPGGWGGAGSGRAGSVREGVALPVGAEAVPDAEQAAGLEEQEGDDQDAVH